MRRRTSRRQCRVSAAISFNVVRLANAHPLVCVPVGGLCVPLALLRRGTDRRERERSLEDGAEALEIKREEEKGNVLSNAAKNGHVWDNY